MAVQQQLESIFEMDPTPILDHLQKSAPLDRFFTDVIASLPYVELDGAGAVILVKGSNRTPIDTLSMDPIGRGKFSVIFKSVNNTIFKKITLAKTMEADKLELAIRSLFLEVFIQTVLSLDSYVGNSICKAFKLYRSEDATNIILFLQIEYVDTSFDNEIKKYKKAGEPAIKIVTLLPMFLQLQQIMAYLQDTYAFQHHDLHYKNIMFSKDFMKLIDFGLSTIVWKGTLYALPTDKGNPSYDLYLLFSSIIQWLSEAFSKEDVKFLKSLLYNPNADEGKEDYYDFYTYAKSELGEEDATDAFYADAIAKWSPKAVETLGPFPSPKTAMNLARNTLSKKLLKCVPAGGVRTTRGGRRSRSRSRCRRTKTRKN